MQNALPTYDFANFTDKGFIKKKTFKDIESYDIKVILEYEEFFASISTYIGVVNINGYNINLEKMTNDDMTNKNEADSDRMPDG